mgnify:CR=1 FL=1
MAAEYLVCSKGDRAMRGAFPPKWSGGWTAVEFCRKGYFGQLVIQEVLNYGIGAIRIVSHDYGGEIQKIQGIGQRIGDIRAEFFQNSDRQRVVLITC